MAYLLSDLRTHLGRVAQSTLDERGAIRPISSQVPFKTNLSRELCPSRPTST